MNHLEEAKKGLVKMQGWYDDGAGDTYDFNTMLLTHALIAIAESLEKIVNGTVVIGQNREGDWAAGFLNTDWEDK